MAGPLPSSYVPGVLEGEVLNSGRSVTRPLISLCVIVRDEAERIGRCLSAAAPLADEIVVGDTGSTDETIESARRFGARVVRIPWGEDFAKARNACLDEARGSWTFFVDADEVLETSPRRALTETLAASTVPAYSVEIVTRLGWQQNEALHATRLVRNDARHRFEGRVCEDVLPSVRRALGDDDWLPPRSGLRLLHSRPAGGHGARSGDERFERLLRRELRARPEDPSIRYTIAKRLVRSAGGDLLDTPGTRRALDVLAPAVESLRRTSQTSMTDPALCLGVRLAVVTGDHCRAALWSSDARRLLGPTARWCYAEGERLLQAAAHGSSDPRRAERRFLEVASAEEGSELYPTERSVRGAWSTVRAIACRIMAGSTQEGWRESLPAGADRIETLLVMAFATVRRKGPLAALPQLVEIAERDRTDPRGWWAHASALALAGRTASAGAMLAAARAAAPGWSPVISVLGGARLNSPAGILAPWSVLGA